VLAQHRLHDMSGTEPVGIRIKRERLAREMTQRQLADRIGVGVPHVSKVEAGRESPSDELLVKIAEVLEIDPGELLLAAKRVPEDLLEQLAADPAGGIEFLRRWQSER